MSLLATLLLITSTTLHANETGGFCKNLAIGESIKVDNSFSGSESGVEQHYTLVRNEENTYDIYINPKFSPAKDYDGETAEKKAETKRLLTQSMRKRMNECFRLYDKELADEKGRSVRLHVYNPETDKGVSEPPVVKVKIGSSGNRSHSRNYANGVKCPVLIHETFHLLGLVDEYEEQWMALNPHIFERITTKPFVPVTGTKGPAFDCRSIGAPNSIMKGSYILYSSYSHVLFSGQLDVILYPNCKEENNIYYSCAKNSIRTSKEHGGFLGCRPAPDICKTEGDWLVKN